MFNILVSMGLNNFLIIFDRSSYQILEPHCMCNILVIIGFNNFLIILQIFNGNNNAEIPVTNHFKCVFQARYVRIYPVPGQRKCLRFDILGCRLP